MISHDALPAELDLLALRSFHQPYTSKYLREQPLHVSLFRVRTRDNTGHTDDALFISRTQPPPYFPRPLSDIVRMTNSFLTCVLWRENRESGFSHRSLTFTHPDVDLHVVFVGMRGTRSTDTFIIPVILTHAVLWLDGECSEPLMPLGNCPTKMGGISELQQGVNGALIIMNIFPSDVL